MRSLPNLREVGSLLFSLLVFFVFVFIWRCGGVGGGIIASSGGEQPPPGGWQL